MLAVALDEVEHQALAQRQVAERDVLGLELLEQRIEQQGAGHDQIGAARVERRNLEPLVERRAAHELAHLANRLGRHAQVAHFARRHAGVECGRHRAERQNGARRADDAVVAGADDVPEVAVRLFGDVREHLAFVAAAERVGHDEAFRQPEHAQLEAARETHVVTGAERHLDAAAADVDDDRRLGRVDAVNGGQMNEPRFFGAGDDARPDAGLLLDGRQQVAAVLGLAGGARGRGQNLVDLVGFGEPLELAERLQGRAHGLARQLPSAQAAGAEPHHFLFPIDHLEGKVRAYSYHDHVDRVGADVDGGKTHGQVAAIMAP